MVNISVNFSELLFPFHDLFLSLSTDQRGFLESLGVLKVRLFEHLFTGYG